MIKGKFASGPVLWKSYSSAHLLISNLYALAPISTRDRTEK